MKCIYSVLDSDRYSVVIEKDRAYLEFDNEKGVLKVKPSTCFNTLISLFSLKEEWENKECNKPIYRVKFENDGVIEEYLFDYDVPFNFNFFMSYVNRLVGEYI